MDEVKLRECPLCNSPKVRMGYMRDGQSVNCTHCYAMVVAYNPNAAEKAVAKWNTRPHDAELTRLRERVRALSEPVSHLIVSHPATETTRSYDESTCAHCNEPIWRTTDGHTSGWMHRDQWPPSECKIKRTLAAPSIARAAHPDQENAHGK